MQGSDRSESLSPATECVKPVMCEDLSCGVFPVRLSSTPDADVSAERAKTVGQGNGCPGGGPFEYGPVKPNQILQTLREVQAVAKSGFFEVNDLYAVLGVFPSDEDVFEVEITVVYARIMHPGKSPGNGVGDFNPLFDGQLFAMHPTELEQVLR